MNCFEKSLTGNPHISVGRRAFYACFSGFAQCWWKKSCIFDNRYHVRAWNARLPIYPINSWRDSQDPHDITSKKNTIQQKILKIDSKISSNHDLCDPF